MPYKPHVPQDIQKARRPPGSRKRHSGMLRRVKHAVLQESTTVSTRNLQECYLQGHNVEARLYSEKGNPIHD